MPPKGKAKAKPKGKGKAKAKPKSLPFLVVGAPPVIPPPFIAIEDDEDGTNVRSLERRSSDEQVERYCERKLSHVPDERMETLRDGENLSIKGFIKKELRQKRLVQGRLASAFTVILYTRFDLLTGTWDLLPKPVRSVRDNELIEFLELCHDENPCLRSIKPLIGYLLGVKLLDQMNFIALLKGVLAGPLLAIEKAFRLQAAVLEYIARTEANIHFPREWEIVKCQLDVAMRFCHEKSMKDGVSTAQWLTTRARAMKLYAPGHVIDDLIGADGDYAKVPDAVKLVVQSNFLTARSVFKDAWLGCAKHFFFEELNQSLKDLEHNNFDVEEVASFHAIQNQKATDLKKLNVNKRRLKWRVELELFNMTLEPWDLNDPRDMTAHQFWNRIKTIVVNTRQVRVVFYEDLLFPIGSLDGVPTTLQLHASLIAKIAPARNHAFDVLKDCVTMDQAIKKLKKAYDALIDLDPHYESDYNFATKRAKPMMIAKVAVEVGECMPTSVKELDIGVCLGMLQAITRSPLAVACGKDFVDELKGCVALVTQLSGGHPPRDEDVPRMAPLASVVLNSCQFFLKYDLREPCTAKKGTLFAKTYTIKTLRGTEALLHHYNAVEKTLKEDGELKIGTI